MGTVSSRQPNVDKRWTWRTIRARWPGVTDLGYERSAIVEAFNLREELLGAASSPTIQPQVGTYAPLQIVCDGRRLSALNGIPRTERFVSRLRRADASAWSELEALYILRSGPAQTDVELDPRVRHGTRDRLADNRIRERGLLPWTYVEVTRPDVSRAHASVRDIVRESISKVTAGERRAVSLTLRRRPLGDELSALGAALSDRAAGGSSGSIELPRNLGTLAVQSDRIEAPQGLAMIRTAIPDPRGVDILSTEAAQLPADSPALVMVDVEDAMEDWAQSIRDAFAAKRYRWVSAAALFASGFIPGSTGESWVVSVRLLENPNAVLRLPSWIFRVLERFSSTGAVA